MMGTFFVVVFALAIATIACELLDPKTAPFSPSKAARRN